jgi:hypothetical protein
MPPKRHTTGYKTMIPELAFREGAPLTKEQGIIVHHIYKICGLGLKERLETVVVEGIT